MAGIRVGQLNSANCNGATLQDLDFLFNYFICNCGGHVPTANDSDPIIQLANPTQFEIRPSMWAGSVTRYYSNGAQWNFNIPVQLPGPSAIYPTFSGNDGCLIVRIPRSVVDPGANVPAEGCIYESPADGIEFIEGSDLTCEDLQNAVGTDGFVLLGCVQNGDFTLNQTCICAPCIEADKITANTLEVNEIILNGVPLTPGGGGTGGNCLCASIDSSSGFRRICWENCDGDYVNIYYRNWTSTTSPITTTPNILLASNLPVTGCYTDLTSSPTNDTYYIVECVKLDGNGDPISSVFSTILHSAATGSGAINIACDEFGGGVADYVVSNGTYSLNSGVHFYKDFRVENATLQMTGDTDTLIFLEGDLYIDGTVIGNYRYQANPFGTINVCNRTFTVSDDVVGAYGGGLGGAGGPAIICLTCPGPPPHIGPNGVQGAAAAFNRFAAGANALGGAIGGAAPTQASPNGNDGQAGQSALAPGAGASHGLSRASLIFVVRGNVVIIPGSTFILDGANGGNGGRGWFGFFGGLICPGPQGGGGGGGGGRGGKGGDLVIWHRGSYSASSVNLIQNGGASGAGGVGGTPQCHQWFACIQSTSCASPGNAGTSAPAATSGQFIQQTV